MMKSNLKLGSCRDFSNQEGESGAHINISGIGLTQHAKNKENALKLIEFLTDVEAQTTFKYEF